MRQLTDAMRAATEDPPPTTVDIESLISGNRRRSNRLRLLAVAGVVALAAGAAPLVASMAEPPARPLVRDYYDPAAPPTPVDRAGPHGWTDRAASLAEAALPEGYRMGEPPIEYWGGDDGFQLMWADVVADDGQRHQLLAHLELAGDPAPPPGEVCAVPPIGFRFAGEELTCEPLTAAGLELRVGTARDAFPGRDPAVHFDFPIVSRHGDGWAIYVWELPYQHPMHQRDAQPELADERAFTVEELAALAAHPDLVPD